MKPNNFLAVWLLKHPAVLRTTMAMFILVAASSLPNNVLAQTPTPTPVPQNPFQDEINELQHKIDLLTKQAELLTKEKAEVVAEKDLIKAYLPTASATPLTGSATLDSNAVMESHFIAYKSMSEVAKYMGTKVTGFKTLVVYNDRDVSGLQHYATVIAQLENLQKYYSELLKKPSPQNPEAATAALLAPELATTMLKSVADVLAMFRTNTDIKGVSITIEEAAFVSQLKQHLTGVTLMYPGLYPPNLLVAASTDSDSLMKMISNIFEQKVKADEIIKDYEASTDKKAHPYRDRVTRFKAMNDQFDKFVAALTALDATTGASPMTNLVRAEKLHKTLKKGDSGMLYVKVMKAGGNNKITQNLFKGTKISHSGGVVVSYIIFNNSGEVALADTLYNYDGYLRIKSKEGTLTSNFVKQ
jgi:hypothetical protein